MLNEVKKILPNNLKHFIKEMLPKIMYGRLSYSQEGEDLILMRILENKTNGFYIDVGAHHPFRFSNTCIFYKKGWRGINIDPKPGVKKLFSRFRPRDITIEKGVSVERAVLKYHVFNEGALNTFDEKLAEERLKLPHWKLQDVIEIECIPLKDLLDEYMPSNVKEIAILSVDAEGHDLSVLQSNDWEKYRPLTVVVECFDASLEAIKEDSIVIFMKTVGYKPFAKAYHSIVFRLDIEEIGQ